MASKQAYKTKITIAFSGSEYIKMSSDKIKYIVIEQMYEAKRMPVIYISISVEADLYNTILEEKDSAKIYLRIQKYDAYSKTSLYKDYIKGMFTYTLPSATPEYSKNLSDANDNIDSAYRTLTIGLMSMTIMNTIRKSFSGFLKNIDLHSLVYKAIKDTKIVLKTPKYNTKFDTVYLPNLTSRYQFLTYIFSLEPFYDTDFLYFIDFDKSYLLDRTGEAVSANDGQYNDIIIDIRSVTDSKAYSEGMEQKNGSYYIYINPANAHVSMDVGTEKIANQLVAGDEDGTTTIDLNINSNTDSTTKQTFKRLDKESAIVYKNTVESAQVCIELVKENIDSRYITPNKTFNITNYEGYEEYSGKYVLIYKKEVIQGASSDYASITTFGIRKVGNIQTIGYVSANNIKKNTSSTAKTSSYSTKTTKTTATKGASTTSSK
jgi:hypothetical protein